MPGRFARVALTGRNESLLHVSNLAVNGWIRAAISSLHAAHLVHLRAAQRVDNLVLVSVFSNPAKHNAAPARRCARAGARGVTALSEESSSVPSASGSACRLCERGSAREKCGAWVAGLYGGVVISLALRISACDTCDAPMRIALFFARLLPTHTAYHFFGSRAFFVACGARVACAARVDADVRAHTRHPDAKRSFLCCVATVRLLLVRFNLFYAFQKDAQQLLFCCVKRAPVYTAQETVLSP